MAAAVQQWARALAPDADRWLAAAFKGTGFLQGTYLDFVLATAIACAFPAVRWLMDNTVYGVSKQPCQIGVLGIQVLQPVHSMSCLCVLQQWKAAAAWLARRCEGCSRLNCLALHQC